MTAKHESADDNLLQKQRNHWRSGRPVRLGTSEGEEFFRDISPTQLMDCIYNEVLLRRSIGESPTLDDYLSLYPHLNLDLQSLFEIDRSIGYEGLSVSAASGTQQDPVIAPLNQASTTPGEVDQAVDSQDATPALQVRTSTGKALPVTEVLRKRLLIASAVLALNYAQAYPQMKALFDASVIQVWIQIPLSLCFAATALALWRQRKPTMGWLRLIEAFVFWLPILQLSMFLIERVWWKEDLVRGLQNPDGRLGDLMNTMILCYLPIVVAYGVLIPNKLKRCLWVTCAMACVPAAILLFGIPTYDVEWKEHWILFVRAVVWVQSWMMISVVIASFGSYRIQELTRQVAEARQLGSYRLKHQIGSGGMGQVYLAEHRLLKQPCAVKLIRPDRVNDPQATRRFEREAQAMARLRHPNSIAIYDYGVAEDGTFYYAMEYLDGKNAEQLVKESGPMPVARGLHLLLGICGPLQEAHRMGLVHRDLKPANVILYVRGGIPDSVKLLDFGLVKDLGHTEREKTLTRQNAVAGTPAYMSPEQIVDASQLDPRSDIYSLGALAYFIFSGRPIFEGNAVQILADQLHLVPSSLKDQIVDFPIELSDVIDRCLAKRPENRYESVESLTTALRHIANEYPWRDASSVAKS